MSAADRGVRVVHLGLGNFFRAHQAWYTARAADAESWGIAAFSGRSADLAQALAQQGGRYTLVTRGPAADAFETVTSVVEARAAADGEAWLRLLAAPSTAVVTLTVTEAGYRTAPAGVPPGSAPASAPASVPASVPARLVAGLAARMRADAGPIALVPCDNLPDNGDVLRRALLDLADPALAAWIRGNVATVTTVVDRITPRTTSHDVAVVRAAGRVDAVPVVTEPFTEWVLSGSFPAGRPDWESAGARVVGDVTPYEQRKLWLLNGGHSLLAYAGLLRGHETVADAVADDALRARLGAWWQVASAHLAADLDVGPDADPDVAPGIDGYRAALLERFANRRMRHLLRQIAVDGSQKLPVRVLPVLRRERTAGRLPEGAVQVLAAWVAWVRAASGPGGAGVDDVRAADLASAAGRPDAVRHLLAVLDPALADDTDLVTAVAALALSP